MPRTVTPTLAAIFAAPSREIEWLLDIAFPGIAALRLATGKLMKSLIPYENRIEGVSEILQTIEKPVNDVTIVCSNKDFFFDSHLTENFEEWQLAEAVLYRRYLSADKSLFEDVEMFRGAIEKPILDDPSYNFTFTIIPDTISKGFIVADRTLALACSFVFKDPQTCAYSGPETFCDHLLKSDCAKYANTHHFGGTESRYSHRTSTPGSDGNDGTGGGEDSGGNCFAGSILVNLSDSEEISFAELFARRNEFIGTEIKSFDDDGAIQTDQIADIFRHTVYEYLSVKFSTDIEPMLITAEHPFFTESKKFREIGDLTKGSKVWENDGADCLAEIESTEPFKAPSGIFVYNLTTVKYHHYLANRKKVHNKPIGYETGQY